MKSGQFAEGIVRKASPSSRGRGLKYINNFGGLPICGRPLHEGVD
ncbi:hypothetical protein EUBSIR_01897 [[Eubacterium] siraeum DSM 15702]|uniref:Uncharacterized protein n=1 Tax=[Eubacterium] siraeum DSM 15702 TaxID=428128 RepID=B0MPU4_9FIRM|nr:hypothetical protein EUBSIR_01897 [[Eubacterium] siraeum DSM 15702]